MVEEAEIQKLKNEYPEFFAQFSPDFLDFVFSEETSLGIASICLENKIEDEEVIGKIAYRVALVLLNQVPKENLAGILEKGAGLNHETAEKVSATIEERIFSQIPTPQSIKSSLTEGEEAILPPETQLETELKKTRKDIYREPIE